MNQPCAVPALRPFEIELLFDDVRPAVLDLGRYITGPLFEQRRDPALFCSVALDPMGGLEWANGASIAPEVVELLAHAASV